jgi:hypothetical protein
MQIIAAFFKNVSRRITAKMVETRRGRLKSRKYIAHNPYLSGLFDHALKQFARSDTQYMGDVDELDDVDSTFTRLDASYKGMWPLEAGGQIALCEPSVSASLDEDVDQNSMPSGTQCLS